MTMMMRQDFSASGGGASDPNRCLNCGVKEWPLYEVYHQRNFRKLCTSCVLRLHPQSFCPTCFTVYDHSQPNASLNSVVACIRCYSASHYQCVGPSPPIPFLCPMCVSPKSQLFNPKRAKDANLDGEIGNDDNRRVIDKKAARVFLAAARIAAMSTSKAAVAANVEAEKRASEAASTRKHARDALEHLEYMEYLENLVAQEKMGRREFFVVPPDASRPGGVVGMSERNMSTPMAAEPVQLDDRNQFGNLNRLETSSEVLAALNAVDLKDRSQELEVQNPVFQNGNMMDVEQNGESTVVSSDLVNMGSVVRNAIKTEKTENVDNIENCNIQGMRLNNDTVLEHPVDDRNQQIQHIHAGEQINGASQQ